MLLGCRTTQHNSLHSPTSTHVTPSAVLEPTAALEARFQRVLEAFHVRGATPLAERFVGFVRGEHPAVFTVTLAEPRCVGFVGVGREGVDDLNLSVMNASGVELGRDNRPDAHPYARVCPSRPETLSVVVDATQGGGEVAVGVLVDAPVVPPALEDVLGPRASTGILGARSPRVDLGRDPAGVSAEDALARASARLGEGYTPVGTVQHGVLERRQSLSRQVTLEEGRCYVILGAGSETVDDLDLRVYDAERRPVGNDLATDAHPAVRLCPDQSGPHTVEVVMYAGSGQWALGVHEIEEGHVEIPEDLSGPARARALELGVLAWRRGLAPLGPALRGQSWGSATSTRAYTVREGRCYLFGATAGERNGGVELWASDPSGAVLGADTGERERAQVFHCARRTERVTVSVRPAGGRGDFVFVAFESRDTP